MARRLVAGVAALLLFAEAVGFVLVNHVLATVADRQSMSIAEMDSDVMVAGTYVMGAAMGGYLLCCGLALLAAALRDRAPGRFGRVLLISCAVAHGVLGALAVGLVGWHGFAFMATVLVLDLLALTLYGKRGPGREAPADPAGGAGPEQGGPVADRLPPPATA
ncbi:hypothetical protein LG634_33830 [Streptomyces bambusae]|uniref:hypothetical protein n=1 Tax=Streptomyces bambusae TaxID=1550616 RepID=UPI001CFFDBDE|nr:hypothetical protein [Streptomyces bambusae]MCB5169768.1 hypothetical protein [Streptomyces bambusae]